MLLTETTAVPSLDEILRDRPGWLEEAVDPAEASHIVGRTEGALAVLRSRGGGPVYIKIGRNVRYQRRALLSWLRENRHCHTADKG